MKITLEVDDSRYETFLSFIKTLDYVSLQYDESVFQSQVEETRSTLGEVESGKMTTRSWEDAKKDIFKK